MQNGPKTNPRRPQQAGSSGVRAKHWSSNGARPQSRGPQNAQRNYERYLALAQAQAQSGDIVGAENYYQHAEHYYRSMSADRETTQEPMRSARAETPSRIDPEDRHRSLPIPDRTAREIE
jgi:uncharacterized protein DUF4167